VEQRDDDMEFVNRLGRDLTLPEVLRCKRQALINHGIGGLENAPLEEVNRRFRELPGEPFVLKEEGMIPREAKPVGWGFS
jgi:hypothetical protein